MLVWIEGNERGERKEIEFLPFPLFGKQKLEREEEKERNLISNG